MLNDYNEGNGLTFIAMFGEDFGRLLSRVQGTVVSAGTAVQRALIKLCPRIQRGKPDLLVDGYYVVELKLGEQFDTKKAAKELEVLKAIADANGGAPTLCCFFSTSVESIVKYFKADLGGVTIWTGQDLCDLVGLEFSDVLSEAGLGHPDDMRQKLLQEVWKVLAKETEE